MSKIQADKCYFCGKPATSAEHVPPKCLFPEQKDMDGENYRKNLFTVPSCDKHNMQKSKDDEFLMACLAPVVGNNATAFIHTNTKLARTYLRNPRLIEKTILDSCKVNIVGPGGITFPTLVGRPDMPRLSSPRVSKSHTRMFLTQRQKDQLTLKLQLVKVKMLAILHGDVKENKPPVNDRFQQTSC